MKSGFSCHNRNEVVRIFNVVTISFSVFAEEIGNVCNQRSIVHGRIQDQCIDMGNVYDFADESRQSSWAEFQVEIGNLQEHSTLLKSW